ncbi:MAG: hypothetical protein R8M45_10700 [Ghiorsea sp.]
MTINTYTQNNPKLSHLPYKKKLVTSTIKRKKLKTYSDARFAIAVYKLRSELKITSKLLTDLYESTLSWQERIAWAVEVRNYKGTIGDSLGYLIIRFHSEEKAIAHMKKKSDRVKGKNNPAYNHGGKFSPFSKKFVKYANNEEYEKGNAKAQQNVAQTKLDNPDHNPYCVEYWLARSETNTIKEAEKLLTDYKIERRTTTFSKKLCIEKHGEVEGTAIWQDRQDRWQKTINSKSPEELADINRRKMSTGGISKPEKELGEKIVELMDIDLDTQHPLTYGKNDKSMFLYDFRYGIKIVEFNGDFWHANPNVYEKDFVNNVSKKSMKEIHAKYAKKNALAESKGYEIMTVWEKDYNEDKNMIAQQCANFLGGQ